MDDFEQRFDALAGRWDLPMYGRRTRFRGVRRLQEGCDEEIMVAIRLDGEKTPYRDRWICWGHDERKCVPGIWSLFAPLFEPPYIPFVAVEFQFELSEWVGRNVTHPIKYKMEEWAIKYDEWRTWRAIRKMPDEFFDGDPEDFYGD